jgi:glycine dehydrogenase subunit 1
MSYTPHTDQEVKQMLGDIGVSSLDELFKDIPSEYQPASFNLPEGRSEFEVYEHLKRLADKNATGLVNFLGCGFYDHHIPAAVEALAGQPGFYTAYTPYQPECSQGTLQAIYEYQSAISLLTDMDVANASLYDGGTALYEAGMMALRITGRNKILIDGGVNPIYRRIMYTYTSNLAIDFVEIPVSHGQSAREEIYKYLDDKTAAIILQNPNFFGAIDDHSDVIERVHSIGALAIESVYPISLGMIKTPGDMGADIVTGEGQSLGLPLSFGGSYLGFLAARQRHVRKMPGRIVGGTMDREGNRAFVLTLQAREQHIRREKATSNICSNESLCALKAIIYLSLLGRQGLIDLARLNFNKAEFAKDTLDRIKGVEVKRSSPTFNEFTVYLPRDAREVIAPMIERGFSPGLPLAKYYKDMENYLLICVTEKRTKEEIVRYAENLEAVLWS